MKSVASKIKPTSGFSQIFHNLLVLLFPALLFILVRIGFVELAAVLILLSKWRMFAVRMRYWPTNIRANSVDLIIGFSILIFMTQAQTASLQLVWAVLYGGWLLLLKPAVSVLHVSLQAMAAQLLGLAALFLAFGGVSTLVLMVIAWMISYTSARHFFVSFEERYASMLSHTWAYFAAALTWILSHWLLFYGALAQPALILSVIGFSLAALYYLNHHDRLSPLLRRQFVFIMVAIITVVLVLSDWGDKTV